MVWIHGGGLQWGSSVQYNSSSLSAAEDIVVVTINYRLGTLDTFLPTLFFMTITWDCVACTSGHAAFFADPALKGSRSGSGAANGFLDMIEALKWVQHNIKSFGGDPNQVTVAGESAGGWGVCGLVLSPLAKGLFKQSIQMSGAYVTCIQTFCPFDDHEPETCSDAYHQPVEHKGVSNRVRHFIQPMKPRTRWSI